MFGIIDYAPQHLHDLAVMARSSFERAVGITDPHPLEEQMRYYAEKVIPSHTTRVVIALESEEVVGFLATTPTTIAQLYIHTGYQGRGIGTRLLNIAKQESSGRLRLFTFASNKGAQRFYEKHGFVVIARGFEEEWGLEDIEYEWVREELGVEGGKAV